MEYIKKYLFREHPTRGFLYLVTGLRGPGNEARARARAQNLCPDVPHRSTLGTYGSQAALSLAIGSWGGAVCLHCGCVMGRRALHGMVAQAHPWRSRPTSARLGPNSIIRYALQSSLGPSRVVKGPAEPWNHAGKHRVPNQRVIDGRALCVSHLRCTLDGIIMDDAWTRISMPLEVRVGVSPQAWASTAVQVIDVMRAVFLTS